jgi:hypothetical protein
MSHGAYIIEDSDGNVRGVIYPATEAQAVAHALAVAEEMLDNADGRARDVDLYQVPADQFATKIAGGNTDAARIGTVRWVFPGELQFLRAGEKEPRPSEAWMAANNPFSDDDEEDDYDPSDPKSRGYHDRMSAAWDNREKGT